MTELRKRHLPGAMAAACTSAAMIAQQVVGKAVRDTLFLSSFEARFLPIAMASAAVLSLAVVYWLSRLLVRRSPAATMPWLFGGSALALVLSWLLGLVSAPLAAIVVYFHTALLGPVLITTFWSMINERFDPHTAKHAVARISGGGTLGGMLGGLAAWRISHLVELSTMLLFLSALNVLCVVGSLLIAARKGVDPYATNDAGGADATLAVSAFGVLRRAPFLRNLALLVALGAALSALLDYVFSAQVAAALPKGAPLLSFFSLFWLGVGVVSFVLQLALGRIALEKLGLAVSIALLPGTIILGGAFGLAVPGLASSSILRASDAVQRNTLFRSAYELLYTPISQESKRATKALIDVGFDRAGTLFGSLLVVIALRLVPHGASTVLLVLVVLIAFATLPVVQGLHRGYVRALEQGLRDTAQKLGEVTSSTAVDADADAHRPSIAIDAATDARDALIDRLQALELGPLVEEGDLEKNLATRHEPLVASKRAAKAVAKAKEARAAAERVLDDARDLLSGDLAKARIVLGKPPAETRRLAAWIIPLLAHPALHRDSKKALSRNALVCTGQLVDALLDPTTRPVIRRRVPRVLSMCNTQRAAEGLVLGLADASFEVRYECSRALVRVRARNPEIVFHRTLLDDAVLAELALATPQSAPAAGSEAGKLAAELIADRSARRLKHVFAILSLKLDREPLQLAFDALFQDDERHRGTALEYLETVLRSDLREALWPHLGAASPLNAPRPAADILADLTRTAGERVHNRT